MQASALSFPAFLTSLLIGPARPVRRNRVLGRQAMKDINYMDSDRESEM